LNILALLALFTRATGCPDAAISEEKLPHPQIHMEVLGLPLPWPMLAYSVHPTGPGRLSLIIMNRGVSLNPKERSFFPLVEFRDAAFWFARRAAIWSSRPSALDTVVLGSIGRR
jgi:hypothetical protein